MLPPPSPRLQVAAAVPGRAAGERLGEAPDGGDLHEPAEAAQVREQGGHGDKTKIRHRRGRRFRPKLRVVNYLSVDLILFY